MTRPNTDHVVIHDEVDGLFELKCEHCADFHHPRLPIPALLLSERIRGFVLMHRLCPKPVPPSPQLPLPGTDSPPKPCRDCGTHHQPGECPDPDPAPSFIDEADLRDTGIDASTSDPAPEIDPPGPYARFEEMYPMATDHDGLMNALCNVLPQGDYMQIHAPEKEIAIERWHPASGIFNAVAHWARIEKAHAEAGTREPIAGLTIPRREPMPEKLAELLGVKKPKEKRGARPLTSPKRKGDPKK